ncbi:MAG: T9SS type A sorting domain-containing protein [Flavobacteriales bacterium]|nr:T9SS type A sorting domain-containing protein [Flavobacteriales bacterium]
MIALPASAQSFMRMASGPAGAIIQSVSTEEAIYAIVIQADATYALQSWNGVVWSDPLAIEILPKHGSNPEGEFTVTGFSYMSGDFFISGNYLINTSGLDGNLIVHFDGVNWKDISSDAIRQSKELSHLIVYNDSIYVLGKFRSSENANLFVWNQTEWLSRGTLLTKNEQTDRINDAIVWKNRLYVSGEFSKTGHDTKYSLAEYSNGRWSASALPPFIGQTHQFALWKGNLLLTGSPNSGSDLVKFNDGSGWSTLDAGLSDFKMLVPGTIAAAGDILLMTGEFERINTGSRTKLLYYRNGSWKSGDWSLTADHLQALAFEQDLYLMGSWTFRDIVHAGKFLPGHSVLAGRVFLDLNGNCSKESMEQFLPFTRLVLQPGNVSIYTDVEGYFEVPVPSGDHSIESDEDGIYVSCQPSIEFKVQAGDRIFEPAIGLKPNLNGVDLSVDFVSQSGWSIPQLGGTIWKFCVENRGFKRSGGEKFELSLPDWMSATDFSILPQEVDGKFIWELGALEHDSILCITCKVGSGGGRLGEKGAMTYRILGEGGSDVDPSNNSGSILFEATEQPEPINKQLAEGVIITDVSDLHYHIGVQNIVGRNVNRLMIRDTLDADLYITGIHEYASFPSDLKVDYLPMNNGNYRYILTWHSKADYVMVDSATDDQASREFVQFRVALADGFLEGGTRICNQAEVFLGNSEPLYTNEVCNVVSGVGFRPVFDGEHLPVRLYPIPAEEILNLKNLGTKPLEVRILDLTGRAVMRPVHLAVGQTESIQLKLRSGLYLVQVPGYGSIKLMVD